MSVFDGCVVELGRENRLDLCGQPVDPLLLTQEMTRVRLVSRSRIEVEAVCDCIRLPFTGFALTVKKSEVVDLNMSIDQAVQFMVSCGVVTPAPILGVPQRDSGERPSLSLPQGPLKQDA